jgi:hypothetical protein
VLALYTVIGDLVGSRSLPDRGGVQERLGRVLDEVNRALPPAQPLEPTVGDEFQGGFASLADAARAALLVRLSLLDVVDSRAGLGYGEVTVHDAHRRPLLQDGPGWWAARAAVEELSAGRSHRRTWFVDGAQNDRHEQGSVNAFLTCRDQLLGHLNDRGLRILRLSLLGHSQKAIAEIEGVWPSAVSQQFSRGIGALVDAHRLLAAGADEGAT